MNEHQDDKDSGTSGERELKKLGDLEEGDHEDQEEESEKMEVEGKVESQLRVCPICSKTFLSGKAYGGHMSSAHVQAKGNKKVKYCSQKSLKRKSSNRHGKLAGGCTNLIDESDEDGEYHCSERLDRRMGSNKRKPGIDCRCSCCDKGFPSKKSLFGHMRCHPDRPYRGMDPPNCKYEIKNSGNQENGVCANGKCDIMNSGNPKTGVFGNGKYDIKKSRNQGNGVFGNGIMDAGTSADRGAKRGDLAQYLVGTPWLEKARSSPASSSATSVPMVENSDSTGDNQIYDDDRSHEERCMANLLMYLHSGSGPISNLDDERVTKREMGSATGKALPSEEGKEVFVDFAMSEKAAEETEQSSNGVVAAKSAGVTDKLKNKTKCKEIPENGKDDDSSDDTKTDDELVRKLNYARKGKGKIVVKQKKKAEHNNYEEIVIRKVRIKSSSARDVSSSDISPHSVASVGAPPPPTPPPQPPLHVAENCKEFRCTYCGKIFTTYQALGGHKSSHNKFKMSIHNTKDDHAAPAAPASPAAPAAPAAPSAPAAPAASAAPAAAMEDNNGDSGKLVCDDESPSSAKGKRSCKKRSKAAPEVQKVLDFDLNELPEEER